MKPKFKKTALLAACFFSILTLTSSVESSETVNNLGVSSGIFNTNTKVTNEVADTEITRTLLAVTRVVYQAVTRATPQLEHAAETAGILTHYTPEKGIDQVAAAKQILLAKL
jgi:hypothetical protein